MKKTTLRIIALTAAACLSACSVMPACAAGPASAIVDRAFVPSGSGAVARTYTNKVREMKSVNDFGATGNGVTDDSAAFNKSLAATGIAYLPAGYVYVVQGLTLGAGQRITGEGMLRGVVNQRMFTLSGDGAVIEKISVDTAGATYGFVVTGKHDRVQHVTFSGNVGHYVLVSGASEAQIVGNTFDGTRAASITTPVVVDTSNNAYVAQNRFFDTPGFGIQYRNNSYGGQIVGNVFKQPRFTATATATASQTVFPFTSARPMSRYGVQVNGVPTAAGVSITTSDSKAFKVTFGAGRTAGDVVKFIGYRALETININSRVYDLKVLGNEIDGTGDSGIVIGSDYHNNVLAPNNVTAADYPARITVRNNKVKNAAYAGIAQTHPAPGCIIDDNTVSDNAQIADDFSYSSAILASGINLSVRGNHIANTLMPPTMKSGIVNNAYPTSDGSPTAAQRFGNNTFVGTFNNKYLITNQQAGARRQSVNIEGGLTFDYPAKLDLDTTWSTKPANTSYFSYSNSGAGWSYDTTNKLGGTASLGTIAGAYVNVGLAAQAMFVSNIMRVDFMAKVTSGTSYVQVFSSLEGRAYPVEVDITSTTWKPYTIFFPVFNLDAGSVFLRIGANSGNGNIQNIKISGVRVP